VRAGVKHMSDGMRHEECFLIMHSSLATVVLSLSMLAACATSPAEDVGAGEGASTVDVSHASVIDHLSEALVGKDMVTTADVSFSSSSDLWTAMVAFTLPTAAGITASNGKDAGNLFCTLVTTDSGAGVVSRSIPKGAVHTIASVKPHATVADWYDLTFTDPGTTTASNFSGLCQTNIPFASNATLR